MKKILLSVLCLCAVHMTQAQYWQIPNVNAGTNPGDINNDIEEPLGALTGWTSLLASTTPTWSAATSIPFAFQFNGTAVTQFKASSTGIVTFDVASTLAAPAATNAALPSALIPDMSVCVWGIEGSGTNDELITKTFGTAPNRQFWIQYSSYSIPGLATSWSYWSIVLEESSNAIHIVDHRTFTGNTPVPIAVTAGIQVNATTSYDVAGSPSYNSMSANDPTVVDNSFYTFMPGVQPANDIEATGSNTAEYVTTGTSVPIDLEIRNLGAAAITAYTIKYQDGANPVVSQNVTGVNIPTFGSNTTTFTTPFAISAVGAYNLKVWAELTGDANNANDSSSTLQSGVGFIPTKVVTLEEPTGTWCGWCTRGIVYMDSIHKAEPVDAAVIAVHNGDPMVVAAYDSYIGNYIGGYPSLVVDRKFSGDPSDAFTAFADHIGNFGFADVTQSHTNTGSAYTINVDVKPATDLTGDYRLALIVTENDVNGTGTDWDQVNYYSFQSQNRPLSGGGVDYQAAPNPIPAAEMFYDHVARAVVGTPQGDANSLPSTMMYNQTYSHSFNYTIPANSNAGKMQLVVLLLDGTSGEILNASVDGFYPVGTADLVKNDNINIVAYPNPVNNKMAIDMEVKKDLHNANYIVTDIFGKTISKISIGDVTKGFRHTYKVDVSDLSTGTYMLTVSGDEGSYTSKFMKN